MTEITNSLAGQSNAAIEAKKSITEKISQLWEKHQENLPADMRLDLGEEVSHLLMRLRQSRGALVDAARANSGMVAQQLFSLGAAGISLKSSATNEHAYVMGGSATQPIRLAPSVKGLVYIARRFYGAQIQVRVIRESEVGEVFCEEGEKPTLPPTKFKYPADDKIEGVVAWAEMPDGSFPFVFLNAEGIGEITRATAQLHRQKDDYQTQFRKSFNEIWYEKTGLRRLITQKIFNRYEPLVASGAAAMEKVIDLHDSNSDDWQKKPAALSNEELKNLVASERAKSPELNAENLTQQVLTYLGQGNKEITRRQAHAVRALAEAEVKE